jgi:hypothetical protein
VIPAVAYAAAILAIGVGQAHAGALAIQTLLGGSATAEGVLVGPGGRQSDRDSETSLPGFPVHASVILFEPVTLDALLVGARAFPPFGIDVGVDVPVGLSPPVFGIGDVLSPFPDAITAVPGLPALASLEFTGSVVGSATLQIEGHARHSVNGFLELGVLDRDGMSFADLTQALSHAGSVEKAVMRGGIDAGQVLVRFREDRLLESFAFEVPLGELSIDDVVVTGLAHGVTAVPAPPAMILLATGIIGCGAVVSQARRSRRCSGRERDPVSGAQPRHYRVPTILRTGHVVSENSVGPDPVTGSGMRHGTVGP